MTLNIIFSVVPSVLTLAHDSLFLQPSDFNILQDNSLHLATNISPCNLEHAHSYNVNASGHVVIPDLLYRIPNSIDPMTWVFQKTNLFGSKQEH